MDADSKRRKTSIAAWKNKRDNWFKAEKMAVDKLQHEGYQVLAHRNGWPDIMALKDGKLAFFEIKQGDDTLKDDQKIVLLELKNFGHDVHIWRYRQDKNDFEEGKIG
jgi:Holliday junction resolvase-like predicted endonuclease